MPNHGIQPTTAPFTRLRLMPIPLGVNKLEFKMKKLFFTLVFFSFLPLCLLSQSNSLNLNITKQTLPSQYLNITFWFVTEYAGNLWLCGDSGNIITASLSNQNSWELRNSGIQNMEGLNWLEFVDANIIYAAGMNGTIYKTTNAGISWNISFHNEQVTSFINKIKFFSPTHGLAYGDQPSPPSSYPTALLETTDGGVTWKNNNTYLTGTGWASLSSFISPSIVFLAGNMTNSGIKQYGFWKSLDAGITWSFKLLSASNWLYCIEFKDVNLGIIGMNNGDLLWSKDGWVTSSVHSDPQFAYLGISFVTGTNYAYTAGTKGIVSRINPVSDEFLSQQFDPSTRFNFINFLSMNNGYLLQSGLKGAYIVATGTAPSTPTLSLPQDGATSQSISPSLIWNSSNGATSYTLQVSTSSSFTNYVYNQSGLTNTSQQITGLNISTTYYWHVSATNSIGTSSYSSTRSFTTQNSNFTCGLPITYSGKTYNTIQIGTQCWFKENLDVGTMIQSNINASDNGFIEKWCYNNNVNNCNAYGGLYEWNEAMVYSTTPGTKGICPDGWHIPAYAEFQTLASAVNNQGNALKAVGQGDAFWGGAGTNTSGFSALLAGDHNYYGNFNNLGYYTSFWSSIEYSTNYGRKKAYTMELDFMYNRIFLTNNYILFEDGYSIRCVRGETGTAVEDNDKNGLSTKYILSQNYPNPFNPTTTINYSIPKESFVTIKIYDVVGKEVAVIVNENKSAGSYSIEFDASKLVSGIYFYRMQTGNFIETKKLILIK